MPSHDERMKRVMAFTGPQEQLDQLIDWIAASPSVLRHYKMDTILKGAHMQKLYTIELRVDFADKEKEIELQKTLLRCARHALATATLITDTPKTTHIAVHGDDFFTGKQAILLMSDIIQEGLDATNNTEGSNEISSELAAAFQDGK